MRYFTSDHHFGHKNIIKYCKRPFDGVMEMNEEMAKRWNDIVKPKDEVIYLGDFSLSTYEMDIWLNRLNGTKELIVGNHDTCFKSKRGNIRKYLQAGWKSITHEKHTYITLPDNHKIAVKLCHFPYRMEPEEQSKRNDMFSYAQNRPKDRGLILLCGHIHEKWKVKDKMINVGVDQWKFYPVSEQEIAKLIIKEKLLEKKDPAIFTQY